MLESRGKLIDGTRVATPFAIIVLIPLLVGSYLQQRANDNRLRDTLYRTALVTRQVEIEGCLRGNVLREQLFETQAVLQEGLAASLPAFESQAKLLRSRVKAGGLPPPVLAQTKATLGNYEHLIRDWRSFVNVKLTVTRVDCVAAYPPPSRAPLRGE